jgi:hypothetical protein
MPNFRNMDILVMFWPITMPTWSEACTVFARSNTGVVGSNPTPAWMSVYVYSVFVLSCVWVAVLRRADPPSKESYRLCTKLCIGLQNWKKETAKAQQRAVEPLMNELCSGVFSPRHFVLTIFSTTRRFGETMRRTDSLYNIDDLSV